MHSQADSSILALCHYTFSLSLHGGQIHLISAFLPSKSTNSLDGTADRILNTQYPIHHDLSSKSQNNMHTHVHPHQAHNHSVPIDPIETGLPFAPNIHNLYHFVLVC
eukprot:356133_1